MQVGESEASQLYASGAGHVGGGDDGPPLGQGARTTVQILRSIDGRSALLHRGAPFPALHYKKGRPIDHSILTAYAPPPPARAAHVQQQSLKIVTLFMGSALGISPWLGGSGQQRR